MGRGFLWGGITFIILYTAIPWIITRMLGMVVFRRGMAARKIAITFDDGPDPVYTPIILDLLKKYHVKATFFVLGSKAERFPDLIRRIYMEGHQVGVHNYEHLSNWLLSPRKVKINQVEKTSRIIESITGEKPVYYRPPWGILNLFDLIMLRHYRIVLWSVMPIDWKSSIGTERLVRRMTRRLRDGDIILLHDSGDTVGADVDAPEHMIPALEQVIIQMHERGYQFMRVDRMVEVTESMRKRDLPWPKRLLLTIWLAWEWCFQKLFQIEPVVHDQSLLKLRIRKYRGSQPLMLADGEQIRQGDNIVELHFDNEMLIQMGAGSKSPVQLAIQIIRGTEILLPQIFQILSTDPKYKDVKGLYGISMIHRGAGKLGFTVLNMPRGVFSRMTRLYLRLLLYVMHPKGKERLQENPELLVPKIIAMSKKELLNRYSI